MLNLSIVIVSWNVKELLKECLSSIHSNQDGLGIETFVVDNASQDNTGAMVKAGFPWVKLIENEKNLGFPKANNQAIKRAMGKYILILNPDTVIQPEALKNMVRFMEENPRCGTLGPKLLNPDGTLQLSCRTFPTLKTQLYTTFFLDSLFPKSKLFGGHLMSYWKHDELREVDQPMGAAILFRKKALEEVGIFDEKIFLFYDEVDLCYRIKKAGWKIFFIPQARITHYSGQSFKQWKGIRTSLRGGYIWRKSRNYFFKKHYGAWQVPILMSLDAIQVLLIGSILVFLGRILIRLLT